MRRGELASDLPRAVSLSQLLAGTVRVWYILWFPKCLEVTRRLAIRLCVATAHDMQPWIGPLARCEYEKLRAHRNSGLENEIIGGYESALVNALPRLDDIEDDLRAGRRPFRCCLGLPIRLRLPDF